MTDRGGSGRGPFEPGCCLRQARPAWVRSRSDAAPWRRPYMAVRGRSPPRCRQTPSGPQRRRNRPPRGLEERCGAGRAGGGRGRLRAGKITASSRLAPPPRRGCGAAGNRERRHPSARGGAGHGPTRRCRRDTGPEHTWPARRASASRQAWKPPAARPAGRESDSAPRADRPARRPPTRTMRRPQLTFDKSRRTRK